MTLGEAHNNPGNVKQSKLNPWRGSDGNDARGHTVFSSMPYGIRAMVRTLAAKWEAGKRSIADIIASWAPVTDTIGSIPGAKQNNPSAYADYVAARVHPSAPLNLFDGKGAVADYNQLIALIMAMSEYENAHWKPSTADVLRGIALYHEDFVRG
jgi:hypothetical protein